MKSFSSNSEGITGISLLFKKTFNRNQYTLESFCVFNSFFTVFLLFLLFLFFSNFDKSIQTGLKIFQRYFKIPEDILNQCYYYYYSNF